MTSPIDQLLPVILNVGLAIHNADWNWEKVSSPFIRLYYVVDGNAQIILPSGTYLLKPGYLYYIPAFTAHSCICNSSFSHYYLHIYEERAILNEWNFPIEIPALDIDLTLMKRLCEIMPHTTLPQSDPSSYDNTPMLVQNIIRNEQQGFFLKVELRGIIYQLLARFLKSATPKIDSKDNRIQQAILYICKNIYATVDLDVLSAHACLSKDHFIRLFKKETGTTPLKFINQKKIEKAQLLLITDNSPVKNIAYMLSFDDYSYFNRLFKKITGFTPQEYRHSCYL